MISVPAAALVLAAVTALPILAVSGSLTVTHALMAIAFFFCLLLFVGVTAFANKMFTGKLHDVVFTFDAIFAPQTDARGNPVLDAKTKKPLLSITITRAIMQILKKEAITTVIDVRKRLFRKVFPLPGEGKTVAIKVMYSSHTRCFSRGRLQ